VSAFESQHWALRKEKYLKGTTAITDPYDADSDGDDPEVATAEWTWGKAPVFCPWVKKSENTYDFYVKKADKIFDLLLEKEAIEITSKSCDPFG
jgi:hypothetical protein